MYRGDNKANYPLLVIISHTCKFVFVFAFCFALFCFVLFCFFFFPFFALFCANWSVDFFFCFSFTRYLQKCVTQIYRALYGDTMFVSFGGTQT